MLIAAPVRWDDACFAVPAIRAIRGGAKGAALIPVLGATGKVQLATGFLTAEGMTISG